MYKIIYAVCYNNEVKKQTEGPYYGVSADEVTDSSNWEQLGIVLRYVKEFTPVERLFKMSHART